MAANSVKQIYENYTERDHRVWRQLYDHQINLVERYACREYLEGVARLGLRRDEVVRLEDLNRKMREIGTWEFVAARGFLNAGDFFRNIIARKFPVTINMRQPDEIEFAQLPDIFHDVFGHGPMFCSDPITGLFESFGRVASRHLEDDKFLAGLSKFFWTSFETGLIRQDGEVKIYGGAILSSAGEIENVFHSGGHIRELDIDAILALNYDYLKLQKEYFIVDSFRAMTKVLELLESRLTIVCQEESFGAARNT